MNRVTRPAAAGRFRTKAPKPATPRRIVPNCLGAELKAICLALRYLPLLVLRYLPLLA